MSEHRYETGGLRADALRAGVGLVLSTVLLIVVRENTVLVAILALVVLLFLVFGLRVWIRSGTVVDLADDAISARVLGLSGLSIFTRDCVSLQWQDLCMVRLRYFSTQRNQEAGWMELTLKARKKTLKLDSTIRGFHDIAERAAWAAKDGRLELSPATLSNFGALGITAGADGFGPDAGDVGHRKT